MRVQSATSHLGTGYLQQPMFILKWFYSAQDPSSSFQLNNLACLGSTYSHQICMWWCQRRMRIKCYYFLPPPKIVCWTLTLGLGKNFILKPSGQTEKNSQYILFSLEYLANTFKFVSQRGNCCNFQDISLQGSVVKGEKR